MLADCPRKGRRLAVYAYVYVQALFICQLMCLPDLTVQVNQQAACTLSLSKTSKHTKPGTRRADFDPPASPLINQLRSGQICLGRYHRFHSVRIYASTHTRLNRSAIRYLPSISKILSRVQPFNMASSILPPLNPLTNLLNCCFSGPSCCSTSVCAA